ncbi:hypothetical protein HK100_010529 [Physocladia obscura]|uniref:Cryptic loci regulator 2 N-terminal domain-containing protein n=1 Tax=Physocladia obscura TaxID=109957 RepID=A0AAD5T2F8_9FUNG|nr:hypothetical protein HK100_010529 [Physocladia obscura]
MQIPPPPSDNCGPDNCPPENPPSFTFADPSVWLSKLSREVVQIYRTDKDLAEKNAIKSISSSSNLSGFPKNYKLYQHFRENGRNHDKYLYGHPNGYRFRSSNEFLPHLTWLIKRTVNQNLKCECKACDGTTQTLAARSVSQLRPSSSEPTPILLTGRNKANKDSTQNSSVSSTTRKNGPTSSEIKSTARNTKLSTRSAVANQKVKPAQSNQQTTAENYYSHSDDSDAFILEISDNELERSDSLSPASSEDDKTPFLIKRYTSVKEGPPSMLHKSSHIDHFQSKTDLSIPLAPKTSLKKTLIMPPSRNFEKIGNNPSLNGAISESESQDQSQLRQLKRRYDSHRRQGSPAAEANYSKFSKDIEVLEKESQELNVSNQYSTKLTDSATMLSRHEFQPPNRMQGSHNMNPLPKISKNSNMVKQTPEVQENQDDHLAVLAKFKEVQPMFERSSQLMDLFRKDPTENATLINTLNKIQVYIKKQLDAPENIVFFNLQQASHLVERLHDLFAAGQMELHDPAVDNVRQNSDELNVATETESELPKAADHFFKNYAVHNLKRSNQVAQEPNAAVTESKALDLPIKNSSQPNSNGTDRVFGHMDLFASTKKDNFINVGLKSTSRNEAAETSNRLMLTELVVVDLTTNTMSMSPSNSLPRNNPSTEQKNKTVNVHLKEDSRFLESSKNNLKRSWSSSATLGNETNLDAQTHNIPPKKLVKLLNIDTSDWSPSKDDQKRPAEDVKTDSGIISYLPDCLSSDSYGSAGLSVHQLAKLVLEMELESVNDVEI